MDAAVQVEVGLVPAAAAQPRAWGGARLRAALLVAPFLALIAATFLFAGTDPDYWWHARTGQLIWETGHLPRQDPFSYTSAGVPWVAHEWLSEVAFYLVARQFGYVGNVALCALLGAATALLVYAICRERGLGPQRATLTMLWAFAIMLPLVNVRPQMVTIACLAFCTLALTRYLRRGDTRLLWALPLLFVLWVNLHGGYVIGLVLLGLTVVGEGAARVLKHEELTASETRPSPFGPRPSLRPLIMVSLYTGIATLVSPHGLEGWRYPFTYAGTGNASQRFIAEWQSPDFHSGAFLPLAASLLFGLVVGRRGAAWRPTETLWALVLTLMALQSMRHGSLYAIVVLPLLVAHAGDISLKLPAALTRWRAPLLTALPVAGWVMLIVVAVALLTGGPALHLQTGSAPRTEGYPAGGVAYLREHPELTGNLFNTYGWGGYLIAELYPARLVSIDGRADVHGDALVTRHRSAERLGPDWRATFDAWDAHLVLIDRDSPLATALRDDPAWREAYAGDVEQLFVRESK